MTAELSRARIAHHEAGHATIGWLFGLKFSRLYLSRTDDGWSGGVWFDGWVSGSRSVQTRRLAADAYAACGGPAAEARYARSIGENLGFLGASLFFSQEDIAALIADRQVRDWSLATHPRMTVVEALIARNEVWTAISRLADELMRRESVDARAAEAILKGYIRNKRAVLRSPLPG